MQNTPQIPDIKIHDIKPLLEVQEYSLYYFIVAISIAITVFIGLGYLFFKYMQRRNSFNIRAHHLKLINEITFDDAKKDAYDITLYGATFKDDSLRHQSAYEALVSSLEAYKYKKSVSDFDEDTKHYFDIYKGMIDV